MLFTVSASEPTDMGTARAGELTYREKSLRTPAFMPVGTLATVKSLSTCDLVTIGAECILANTYHLHVRPGEKTVESLGGLHSFMGGWPGLILTDSGGYQVFSLAHLRKLTEEGVTFRAHTDGSIQDFTPESVIEIQETLNSDIMMALDECPAHTMSKSEASESADLTTRWARRARDAWSRERGALFGICQGGMFDELRRRSAFELAALNLPGYGIGGLGVGEAKVTFGRMLTASASSLPPDKPRYLMGIGSPEDLVDGVAAGVDMFDCVLQTREARNGGLLTHQGRINVTNARFTNDRGPIEEGCDCELCRQYSAAYLHHLFRSRELLGYRLATIHNVRWTIRLMDRIRASISTGTFNEFRSQFLAAYRPPDRGARDSDGGGTRAGRTSGEGKGEGSDSQC